jgi:copper homeostasis protein
MVRPRGGDFLYDADELAAMEADIDTAAAEGADGVVLGVLNAAGTIDAGATRALVERARPLSVTFHRAFDMTPDAFEALDALIALGVDRVLTSGQEASVIEGAALIAGLMGRARERIVVMPGGGVTARNVRRVVEALKPREIHFAALEPVPSAMRFRRAHVFMGGELRPPEYERAETSPAAIRALMANAAGDG